MATRTRFLLSANSSDANFRAWINEIHSALLAFGWTQTADTGQINFSTVTAPTAANIIAGFAIYAMGDAKQSTTAVFMKLGFGTGGNFGSFIPRLDVQYCVGGTNGSGTLTGQVSTNQACCSDSNLQLVAATFGNCRMSGDSSSFRCNFWTSTAVTWGCGWTFAIERDKDSSGADTTAGVNAVISSVAQASPFVKFYSQFLSASASGLADTSRYYALLSSNPSQGGGKDQGCGIGTIHTSLGPMRNPMLGIIIVAAADYLILSTVPVTIYGALHNYIIVSPNNQGASILNQWNASGSFGILWE